MGAEDFLPPDPDDLGALRRSSAGCHGCALYERATQTVFGQGAADSDLVMVGEQPGDAEDREGLPFVGPAGRLLDRAMDDAGIDRRRVYVTNAVKHFKWEPRGKVRLHKKPSAREVAACAPWLDAEIRSVRPRLVVCLGATAAQALLGREFRVTEQRGRILDSRVDAPVLATVHPASVLRSRDEASRALAMQQLVDDLAVAVGFLH